MSKIEEHRNFSRRQILNYEINKHHSYRLRTGALFL